MRESHEEQKPVLKKIISGGQTGVDRAALDACLEKGFPCGGWCPSGRLAEDGVIDAVYPLREAGSACYEERTEKNVVCSDGTLILAPGVLEGGTLLTRKLAGIHGKPCLVINVQKTGREACKDIIDWLRHESISVLNIAGPRASKNPGIYHIARGLLGGVIALLEEER